MKTIIFLLLPLSIFAQRDTITLKTEYTGTTFVLIKPFNQPDTLIKAKILVSNPTPNVINGYALIERKEWGWLDLPPLGVDGWAAWHWYDRKYRIVRVKEVQDANKVVIDNNIIWNYKFLNW